MIDKVVTWCNKENPQSEHENLVICYGAELLIENFLKIAMLLVAGTIIGKGYESIMFMVVFCGLRTQAGGFHAKTGWGCGLCMSLVWAMGILSSLVINISVFGIAVLSIVSIPIIIWKVPMTVNRDCYTAEVIKKKKLYSLIILFICAVISSLFAEGRTVIMCAVTLEVITLLLN